MHYQIAYVGPHAAKVEAALSDTRDFLGTKRFDELTELMRKSSQHQATLELMMSFAGVSGFAAKAWAEHILELRAKTIEHEPVKIVN